MKIQYRGIRRPLYIAAAFLLTVAALLPGLANNKVSAAQVTSRSIRMSDSTQGTTGVTYKVLFTVPTTAVIQGIVVDFCDETPLIGDSNCTTPTGFSVGTPSVTVNSGLTGTWTAGQLNTNRTLTLTNASGGSVSASTAVDFDITTITNPTTDNHSFYARILTYTTTGGATGYTAGTPGGYTDYGGVALSTGKVINITARVMESLSFCVYATACSDDPSFTLGHGTNNVLDTTAVDTDAVNFSVSTNAQSGATIRLKGDLLTAGSNDIDSVGATATAMVAGTEAFGVRVSSAGSATAVAPYDHASNYAFDTTATTGTYGDDIATLAGPVNNSVTELTYAATAGNTTAAGIYTAAHQLIATGQF